MQEGGTVYFCYIGNLQVYEGTLLRLNKDKHFVQFPLKSYSPAPAERWVDADAVFSTRREANKWFINRLQEKIGMSRIDIERWQNIIDNLFENE